MISIKEGTQWKALPDPTKYKVGLADLDSQDTTRNERGGLIRNRVAAGKTKIELSFIIQGSTSAKLLKLVEPEAVQVKYFDPRTTKLREIKAYVGDRSCDLVSYVAGTPISEIWWEVSFNLVEY